MCRLSSFTGNRTKFFGALPPAYNFRETERGDGVSADTAFPLLPKMWTRFDDEGISMLVKLETTKFLIYAELDKPNASRIWQLRTGSDRERAMRSCMRLSNEAIMKSRGA